MLGCLLYWSSQNAIKDIIGTSDEIRLAVDKRIVTMLNFLNLTTVLWLSKRISLSLGNIQTGVLGRQRGLMYVICLHMVLKTNTHMLNIYIYKVLYKIWKLIIFNKLYNICTHVCVYTFYAFGHSAICIPKLCIWQGENEMNLSKMFTGILCTILAISCNF